MDAFERDIIKFRPKLRNYALKLTKSPDRADDLVQDTMLRALEKRHTFQDGSNLNGWLITICRNMHLTNVLRKKVLLPDPDGKLAGAMVGADDQHIVLEAKEAVALVGKLPVRAQIVVVKRALGGQYDEIAAECGLAIGTVKSQIHRGRVLLAEMVEGRA